MLLLKRNEINPSTPRSEAQGYAFGVSSIERSGLILSGAFNPDLKSGFGAVERIKIVGLQDLTLQT